MRSVFTERFHSEFIPHSAHSVTLAIIFLSLRLGSRNVARRSGLLTKNQTSQKENKYESIIMLPISVPRDSAPRARYFFFSAGVVKYDTRERTSLTLSTSLLQLKGEPQNKQKDCGGGSTTYKDDKAKAPKHHNLAML